MAQLPPTDTENLEDEFREFRSRIEANFPGGSRLVDHIEDGPWLAVAIEEWEYTDCLVDQALKAYPGRQIPLVDQYPTTLMHGTVHLVPQFVYDLLKYHESDTLRLTDCEWPAQRSDRPSAESDWLEAMLSFSCCDEPHEVSDLPQDRATFDLLCNFVTGMFTSRALPLDGVTADSIVEQMHGFIAGLSEN